MKTKEFQSLMPFIQNVIKEKHKEIVTRLNNHKNAVAAGANQPSSQETTPLQVPLKQRHLYNKQQSLIDEQEEEDYNNKNKKNNDDLDESQTRQIVHGNEARTTTIIRHQPSDTMILNHLENVKEHIDNQLHDYGLEISKSDDLSNLNVNINSIKTDTNNATSTNNNANNDNNDDVDENELIDDDELMTGNTKTIDNLGVWTEKDRLKLSQDQLVSIKTEEETSFSNDQIMKMRLERPPNDDVLLAQLNHQAKINQAYNALELAQTLDKKVKQTLKSTMQRLTNEKKR